MFQSQKDSKKRNFRKERYSNGQLAFFIDNEEGDKVIELSIAFDSVQLTYNEFILKDYLINFKLIQKLIQAKIITQTNRCILIKDQVCPICKVLI